MQLLSLINAELAFGPNVLLEKADFTIHDGDKIGVLGRNGAGKSTLLKILHGDYALDSGDRRVTSGAKIAYLDQSLPPADNTTVYDFVASGLQGLGDLIRQFNELSSNLDESSMDQLSVVQSQLDAQDGWAYYQRIDTIITDMGLKPDSLMSALSGGWRKRVAIARLLVTAPDLMLLDEPTNHLDIPTIDWLERELKQFKGALLVITHDRAFLQNVATSIVEVDRGKLRQWQGDYKGFLVFQEQQLAAEEKENALFDKKLAQEEVWIRQGIKARRTRNEGRVTALKNMRKQHSERRNRTGTADFSSQNGGLSGKIVTEVKGLNKRFGDLNVCQNFSYTIMRGDRIGFIGANGLGKSTLIKLLLGELAADSGSVKLGTKLEVGYFDQSRNALDMEKTVIDNIAEGREFIDIDGKQRHVISYLQDFLFAPQRTRQPVKALSGGEQNRLILAKLFSKPVNLLILDEPTNDLDMETLELLEETLMNFNGTLLLVSHDRAFLDNVVTSTLVFEGHGKISQHVGGYEDWAKRGGALVTLQTMGPEVTEEKPINNAPSSHASTETKASSTAQNSPKKKKLSYKLQRELEELPEKLEQLETQINALNSFIASPEFSKLGSDEMTEKLKQLADAESALDLAMDRWAELDEMS